MNRIVVIVLAVLMWSCSKSKQDNPQPQLPYVYTPRGVLDNKQYGQLLDYMWAYKYGGYEVVNIDTSGVNVIAYVYMDSASVLDANTFMSSYANEIAWNILRYGFTDDYTGKLDPVWSELNIELKFVVCSTKQVEYDFSYNYWWYKPMVDMGLIGQIQMNSHRQDGEG